jgi:hypothetical protein
MEGGAPVTIDTLLRQVKLGITHCAIALNPVAIKRATFGRISLLKSFMKIRWIAAINANDDSRAIGPTILHVVKANGRSSARCLHVLAPPGGSSILPP